MRGKRSRVITLLHARRDALVFMLIVVAFSALSLYGLPERTPTEAASAAYLERLSEEPLSLRAFLTGCTSPLYDGLVLLFHHWIDDGTISTIALRLPSMIATLLLVIGYFVAVCVRRGRSIGRVTIYLLLSTFVLHHFIMTGSPGMLGALFGTWTMVLYEGLIYNQRRINAGSIISLGLLMTLSGLSIGLGGLIVPALAMILWTILSTPQRLRSLLPALVISIAVSSFLLLLVDALAPDSSWLTEGLVKGSYGGLRGWLGLLLPWSILFLIGIGAEQKQGRLPKRARVVSPVEGLTLAVIVSALVLNISTGTSDVTPSLMMAPFVCLAAGEYFRILLFHHPRRLVTLTAVITAVGLLVLLYLLLLFTGSLALPAALLDAVGLDGETAAQLMSAAMLDHRALSLLLMVGPVVAALTVVYQTVRRSYAKIAYSGILMMMLLILAVDLPLHVLLSLL